MLIRIDSSLKFIIVPDGEKENVEALSVAILLELKEYISTSTLRRLFGFETQDTQTISKYVLAAIEKYANA